MWYLILLAAVYIAVNVFLWHRVIRLLRNVHGALGKKERDDRLFGDIPVPDEQRRYVDTV